MLQQLRDKIKRRPGETAMTAPSASGTFAPSSRLPPQAPFPFPPSLTLHPFHFSHQQRPPDISTHPFRRPISGRYDAQWLRLKDNSHPCLLPPGPPPLAPADVLQPRPPRTVRSSRPSSGTRPPTARTGPNSALRCPRSPKQGSRTSGSRPAARPARRTATATTPTTSGISASSTRRGTSRPSGARRPSCSRCAAPRGSAGSGCCGTRC